MRRFATRALRVSLAAAALWPAACGSDEGESRSILEPLTPEGTTTLAYPDVGLAFDAPRNWRRARGEEPEVVTLASGEAVVALWAHEQPQGAPRTRAELTRARPRLLAAVRTRDPSFGLERSRVTRTAGAPAIELYGRQVIGGRRMQVRSIHLYRGDAEYVVEALAPREQFGRVEREVLEPLLDSLSITGRIDRS